MKDNTIDIYVFEKNEQDLKIIVSYLKKLKFPHVIHFYSNYDRDVIVKNFKEKIVILAVDSTTTDIFNDIATLSVRKNNSFVVLLSNNVKVSLYEKIMSLGAKNVIRKPLIEESFLNNITEEYNNIFSEARNQIKRTFTVYSEEKRSGKTLFACNLAKELADKSNQRVLLLDLNNSLNDISYVLNIEFTFDANFYIRKIDDENARKMFSSIVRYKNSNMYIIGTGVMNTNSGEPNNLDLYRFLKNAKRFFKYIVIDTDKSKYDISQYLLEHTDKVFYLVTQNKDFLNEHKTFLDSKLKNVDVDVILSKFKRKTKEDFSSLIMEIEEALQREVYHFIPNCVISMSKTIDQKCTLSELNIKPVPEIIVSYDKLVRKIIGKIKK